MKDMTLHDDPAVTLGAMMTYVVAPEDALLSKAGKTSRAARITKKAEKNGKIISKIARDEVEWGAEMSEKVAIKSSENAEISSLGQLMIEKAEESAAKKSADFGKTFIEVSDINTEE